MSKQTLPFLGKPLIAFLVVIIIAGIIVFAPTTPVQKTTGAITVPSGGGAGSGISGSGTGTSGGGAASDAPPIVSITLSSTSVKVSESFTVTATANDDVGLSNVEIYLDSLTTPIKRCSVRTSTTSVSGAQIISGSRTTSSSGTSIGSSSGLKSLTCKYTTTFVSSFAGTHSFYAKAKDTAGQVKTSSTEKFAVVKGAVSGGGTGTGTGGSGTGTGTGGTGTGTSTGGTVAG